MPLSLFPPLRYPFYLTSCLFGSSPGRWSAWLIKDAGDSTRSGRLARPYIRIALFRVGGSVNGLRELCSNNV